MARTSLYTVMSLTLMGIAACDDDLTEVEAPTLDFETSFEEDQAGFQSDTTDLGDP